MTRTAEPHTLSDANKVAVVSGASVSGLVAATILADKGYKVHVFEQRESYTRNVQWAGRLQLLQMLQQVKHLQQLQDANSFSAFCKNGVARVLPLLTRHFDVEMPSVAEVTSETIDVDRMLSSPSRFAMRARELEANLRAQVASMHPSIRFHNIKFPGVVRGASDDAYNVVGWLDSERPSLIVVCEGAASSTAKSLGIRRVTMSPAQDQFSCRFVNVSPEKCATMKKVYAQYGNECYLGGSMCSTHEQCWFVVDVPACMADNVDECKKFAEAMFERCYPGHKGTMQPAFDKADWDKNKSWKLQMALSDRATAGNNIVLLGDAVGNGHWSVGGGMQLAVVQHGDALRKLLNDIGKGREAALHKYDTRVRAYTASWIELGAPDFFVMVDPDVVKDAIKQAVVLGRPPKFVAPDGTTLQRGSVLVKLRSGEHLHVEPAQPKPIQCSFGSTLSFVDFDSHQKSVMDGLRDEVEDSSLEWLMPAQVKTLVQQRSDASQPMRRSSSSVPTTHARAARSRAPSSSISEEREGTQKLRKINSLYLT
jgi:2-polyprenyl-6-methoxyphenol hydroxylase-like FAD-dependent oxidoreductase